VESADGVRLDTLDNGIRVLTEEASGLCSASLGIWVENGSRHEGPADAGASHFLEHLLFKGTARRSAREVAQAIEDVGGVINAFTGKEYTCYYVKVLPEHLAVGIDVLSDIFLHSTLPPDEIERERGVVVQEIVQGEETPDDYVHDRFVKALWGDHPLGRPIAGTVASVSALNREALWAFKGDRYRPNRVLVSGAGPIPHARLRDAWQATLAALEGAGQDDAVEAPAAQGGLHVVERDLEQAHVCLGVPGLITGDPDRYPAHVLNLALGGGMSSRLFQEIREERGRAYSVYSYLSSFGDGGYLGIYVGTSPAWVGEVIEVSRRVMREICEAGLRPDEVARAKSQMKGNLLLGLDSSDNRMSRIARSQLTLGYVPSIAEMCEQIDAVTAEAVQRVARRTIGAGVLNATVLGRIDEPGLRAETGLA
jgi:predicted Zn-dependent peptidase